MSTPNLVENDTLNVLQLQKLSALQYWARWVGGHLEFDLSWSSEVNFNFPPHLKIILMVCTNYVRSFMLFSKSAQFSQIRELIRSTISMFLLYYLWLNAVTIRPVPDFGYSSGQTKYGQGRGYNLTAAGQRSNQHLIFASLDLVLLRCTISWNLWGTWLG